ncbi:MAG: ribonuclease HI family protein [Deltaproteobacteria bacterium]|nr:ribonuclease HI family protein [Deltaproteobacteria bacterium]
MRAILFADGASRGNPGPAGAGAYLLSEKGEVFAERSKYLGETTNNVAEYHSLIMGLEEAIKQGITQLSIKMDSQLVVRQMLGEYRVKQAHLIPLYQKAQGLLSQLKSFSIEYIPRAQNHEADRLANLALDYSAMNSSD